MSRSRIEEAFPTLAPLFRKAGVGRGLRWITRRAWKPVLAVLLLLFIADGVATLVTGRMVEAEIDKIRARGEYVSYGDLAGQPVLDSENGALLYERAFKLMPKPSEKISAYETLLFHWEKRKNDPTVWRQAQAELDKCKGVFALVEQAQRKPACKFTTNWNDGPGALFTYLARLRQVSRLLSAQALIEAHNGDMVAALRYVKRASVTSETIKNDPTMIHCVVRDFLLNMASWTLRQLAVMGKMPAGDAKELSDYFGRIDLTPGFVNGLRGERVWTIGAFDQARTKGAEEFWYIAGGEPGCPSLWLRFYCSRLGRPWLYRDELRALRYWDRTINISKRDYRTITPAEWKQFDKEIEECGTIGSVVLPVFRRARAAADRSQAEVNGSRILLALQVYGDRNASYPDTLGKLEASLGWGLNLIDPLSGKEFIYKRQGDGFFFYSIGQNLKDDGGREKPKRTPPPLDNYPDDIVWKMDR